MFLGTYLRVGGDILEVLPASASLAFTASGGTPPPFDGLLTLSTIGSPWQAFLADQHQVAVSMARSSRLYLAVFWRWLCDQFHSDRLWRQSLARRGELTPAMEVWWEIQFDIDGWHLPSENPLSNPIRYRRYLKSRFGCFGTPSSDAQTESEAEELPLHLLRSAPRSGPFLSLRLKTFQLMRQLWIQRERRKLHASRIQLWIQRERRNSMQTP